MMQALNSLIVSGKVLYLGISDAPAWVASKANEYARNHGMRQFSVYQGQWSAAHRDFERDIIPMCRAEGMALAPWGSLGGGKFKTAEQRRAQEGRANQEYNEVQTNVTAALEAVAIRKNAAPTGVAIAYVMHKAPYVFPVLSGRKVEHIKGNIDALNIQLSPGDIKEIEAAVPFDLGFPNSFLWGKEMPTAQGNVKFAVLGGNYDHVEDVQVRFTYSTRCCSADPLVAYQTFKSGRVGLSPAHESVGTGNISMKNVKIRRFWPGNSDSIGTSTSVDCSRCRLPMVVVSAVARFSCVHVALLFSPICNIWVSTSTWPLKILF